MRSNGLATILLMIPVLAVPALAIFGVPQFTTVVDSVSSELRDNDRESRVGHSARQSHDELLGDIEGFGPEPESKDDGFSKRNDSLATDSSDRRPSARIKGEAASTSWEEDLQPGSDRPSKPARRRTSDPADDLEPTDSAVFGAKTSGSRSSQDNSSRTSRGNPQRAQLDDAIRLASATDSDREIIQAAAEDVDRQQAAAGAGGKRSGRTDARSSKRREAASEPLTWKTAMERLHELDIHNFRLEPGLEAGQYVFICSITPSHSPRVSYRFEAGADEPLKAIENVLEQVAEWQKRP